MPAVRELHDRMFGGLGDPRLPSKFTPDNTFVADRQGTVVGFGSYSMGRDQPSMQLGQFALLLGATRPDLAAELISRSTWLSKSPITVDIVDRCGQPPLDLPRDDDVIFTALAVDPQHRRLGIGRALAEKRIAHVRERGATRVFVHCLGGGSSHAAALYRDLGFQPILSTRPYYRDGGEMQLQMLELASRESQPQNSEPARSWAARPAPVGIGAGLSLGAAISLEALVLAAFFSLASLTSLPIGNLRVAALGFRVRLTVALAQRQLRVLQQGAITIEGAQLVRTAPNAVRSELTLRGPLAIEGTLGWRRRGAVAALATTFRTDHGALLVGPATAFGRNGDRARFLSQARCVLLLQSQKVPVPFPLPLLQKVLRVAFRE